MTELTTQDKESIKKLNNDAESGNTKRYIDGMNRFISNHGTDLPTVTDNDGSIVDKHAVIDMSRGYHDPIMQERSHKINEHPDIEYWFNDGHNFVPLSGSIMHNILHDTVHYILTHYDRFDNEENPNIHEPVGELKDEFNKK